MSVEGSRWFSTIQRPIRTCHQKSGSCSDVANSEAMTIRTLPSSSVRVLSHRVRGAAAPVGAAGHQPARLGGDRERTAQEGQAPDGVDEADRGQYVAG